jgi:hypothetical protein
MRTIAVAFLYCKGNAPFTAVKSRQLTLAAFISLTLLVPTDYFMDKPG